MEQTPEEYREIHEPVVFDCGKCGDEHETLFENTLVLKYEVDTWANRLMTRCDSAEFWSVFFLNGDEVNLWAEQFRQVVDDDENPLQFCDDEEVHELYRQFKGLEMVQEYELTDRLSRQVAFLAYLLNNTDDALILEELEQPMPTRRTLRRWT